MRAVFLAATAAAAIAPAATAQIDSIRVGVMQHNICVIADNFLGQVDCSNADKEDGPNLAGELRFKSPEFLGWAASPHPYIMGSVNTAGDTSYAAFGLEWDLEVMPNLHIEPGLGYAFHDGELNNRFPNGTPEGVAFDAEHVLLGSRDLFRTSLALTWDLSESFAVQGIYEHLSHGQILGSGRNQGLDEIGVRAVWRFN
jgi:lipid A 3-O-deacylase